MKVEVLPNINLVAERSAAFIASRARAAFVERGQFLFAVSGGGTARTILRLLGKEEVPWGGIHILQVHERIPAAGSVGEDLQKLRELLLEETPIHPGRIHRMPVQSSNPCEGLRRYARTLERLCGRPAILDLVQLELFADGHTASLLASDPVLHVHDQDVALTTPHRGKRYMTLTYPILNRARQVLWIATGKENVQSLFQLENADPSIPASGICPERALILTEWDVAGMRQHQQSVQ